MLSGVGEVPKDQSRRDALRIVGKVAIAAGVVALLVVPSGLSETTKLTICLVLLWLMASHQIGRVGLEHLPHRRGLFSNEPSPIDPQHKKPVIDLSRIHPGEAEFFRHFSHFGPIMNLELKGTIWRVEVQPETLRGGLFLHVYRGPDHVGYLQVKPRIFDYWERTRQIVVRVRIFHARRFELDDLEKFSGPVFRLLSAGAHQVMAAEQEMRSSQIRALWQLGPTVIREAEMDFSFHGQATGYIERAQKSAVQHRAELVSA